MKRAYEILNHTFGYHEFRHHQAEVIAAVNEDTDTTRCRGAGDCQEGETCLTHHLWMDLSDQVRDFLQGISLGDLVKRQDIRRVSQKQQSRNSAKDRAGKNDQIPASNL